MMVAGPSRPDDAERLRFGHPPPARSKVDVIQTSTVVAKGHRGQQLGVRNHPSSAVSGAGTMFRMSSAVRDQLDFRRERCPYGPHWGEAVYQVRTWDHGGSRERRSFVCEDEECQRLHPPTPV